MNFSFLVVLLFVSKCTTKNMVKYLSFTSFLVNTMKWLAGEPAVDPMSVIKHLATAARPNGSTYAAAFHKVYVSDTLGKAVAFVDVYKDEIIKTLSFKSETGMPQYNSVAKRQPEKHERSCRDRSGG